MKAEEFRQKRAKYGAVGDWISVKDAKDCGLIPEAFHNIFKDTCECGSDFIITPNLKTEMCCDPRCFIKTSYQLAEMFSRSGVDGLGYSSCNTVYRALLNHDKALKERGEEGLFRFHTYTEVLLVPWDKYPMSIKSTVVGSEFYSACLRVRSQPVTFPQLVSKLGLASIGSNANKIFDGVNSFAEWKHAVETAGGIAQFCYRQGVYAPDVILSVVNSIEDIAIAEHACALRQSGLLQFKVCITGAVRVNGVSYTKAKFIEACNDLCVDSEGTRLLELSNMSGAATPPFVLYSAQSGSAKYNTGASRGKITDEFGTHDVLMTTTDFYNWLKASIDTWNKNIREEHSEEWLQIMSKELQMMTSSKMEKIQSF